MTGRDIIHLKTKKSRIHVERKVKIPDDTERELEEDCLNMSRRTDCFNQLLRVLHPLRSVSKILRSRYKKKHEYIFFHK